MNFTTHERNNVTIAEITGPETRIDEVQDMLDVMANAGARVIIIPKDNINHAFFDLSSGFAGEMLQKISNYNMRLGILGDFSRYESNSLKDFIYESNKTGQVLFLEDRDELLRRLSN